METTRQKPARGGQLDFTGIGPVVEDRDIIDELAYAVQSNGGHLRFDVYECQGGLLLWVSGKDAPEWVVTIPYLGCLEASVR